MTDIDLPRSDEQAKEEEFVYSQWMKLLMLNLSGIDVLSDHPGPTEMTMEQMRAGFGLGFRFALDRVSEFISQHSDLQIEDERALQRFLANQSEISYLLNSNHRSSELSQRLKRKEGWGLNKKSYLNW